jgi:hypothetical protein
MPAAEESMGDLDQEIRYAFDATSLLLVFVAVLFGTRYPQITEDLQLRPIGGGAHAKQKLRDHLARSLFVNCLPLAVVNGVVFYLFLPLVARIVGESRFDPWGFDFARTAFLVVAGLVLVFFVWSVFLAVRFGGRIREFR